MFLKINNVDTGNNILTVLASETILGAGDLIEIKQSTGNDGVYTIDSVAVGGVSGLIEFTLVEPLSSAVADGLAIAGIYSLHFSDTSVPALVVPTSTVDTTSTSIAFVGRASIDYGQLLQTNTLHLLENFASPTAPSQAITGQQWWDKANKTMRAYVDATWNAGHNFLTDSATFDESNGDRYTIKADGGLTIAAPALGATGPVFVVADSTDAALLSVSSIGNTSISGDLSAAGDISNTGKLTVNTNGVEPVGLIVTNNISLSGTQIAFSGTTGIVKASGVSQVSFGTTLAITGGAGAISMNLLNSNGTSIVQLLSDNTLNVPAPMNVTGATSFSNSVTIAGNAQVTGTFTALANANVSGNVAVDGNVTCTQLTADTVSADGITINNAPVAATDGTNKAYVDSIAATKLNSTDVQSMFYSFMPTVDFIAKTTTGPAVTRDKYIRAPIDTGLDCFNVGRAAPAAFIDSAGQYVLGDLCYSATSGILISPTRTNILVNSGQLASWGSNGVVALSGLDYKGAAIASSITEDGTDAMHTATTTYTLGTTGRHVISFSVKRGSGSRNMRIRVTDNSSYGSDAWIHVDLDSLTITNATGSLINTGEWFEGQFEWVATSASPSTFELGLCTTVAEVGNTYTGDASSSLIVAGLQIESTTGNPTLIGTGTTPITRETDNVSISGSDWTLDEFAMVIDLTINNTTTDDIGLLTILATDDQDFKVVSSNDGSMTFTHRNVGVETTSSLGAGTVPRDTPFTLSIMRDASGYTISANGQSAPVLTVAPFEMAGISLQVAGLEASSNITRLTLQPML